MDRFELSFTELDLLGDVLGLDVRPFPFTFPSVAAGTARPGAEHGATWTKVGNSLAEIPSELANGIASSESGWTGAGAEKARKAVAKIGNQAGEAGQGAQLAGTMTERPATSLSTARANVPKQAHADAQQQAHEKAAHQQAAQVVQTYDQTSAQIASSQPAFAPASPSAKPGGGVVTGGGGGTAGGGGGISPGRPSPLSAVAGRATPAVAVLDTAPA